MKPLSISKLWMKFRSESAFDATMSMTIHSQDQQWSWTPTPEGEFQWSTYIEFPSQIALNFSGRTNKNTLVDADGNILKNRSIMIESLCLDGMSCWQYWLDHAVNLHCENGQIETGRHICNNGTVTIDFDTDNAFFWLARSKL